MVEFIVAIDEARVRFTDDAQQLLFLFLVSVLNCMLIVIFKAFSRLHGST